MSKVTLVRLPPLSSSFLCTFPIVTPASRTSACSANVVASGKCTYNSYGFGFNGTDPPNDTHKKIANPKHDNANTATVMIRGTLGADLSMRSLPGRLRRNRQAGVRRRVVVAAQRRIREHVGEAGERLGQRRLRDERADAAAVE